MKDRQEISAPPWWRENPAPGPYGLDDVHSWVFYPIVFIGVSVPAFWGLSLVFETGVGPLSAGAKIVSLCAVLALPPILFAIIAAKIIHRRAMKQWRRQEEARKRWRTDDIRRAARQLAEWDVHQKTSKGSRPPKQRSSPAEALKNHHLRLEELDEADDALFVMVYRDALQDVARERIAAKRERAKKNERLTRRTDRLNEPRSEAEGITAKVAEASKSDQERFDDLLAGADDRPGPWRALRNLLAP